MFVVSFIGQLFVSLNQWKHVIHNLTTQTEKTRDVFEIVRPHMCLCTSAGFIIWVVGHHISSMQVS